MNNAGNHSGKASGGLWLYITIVTTIITLWACFAWLNGSNASDPTGSVSIKVQLPGMREHASLARNPNGSYSYIVTDLDGDPRVLTPEEFAARLYQSQSSRNLLALVFNISTPLGLIWVSLGLLGQVLFTGRMIVQWLASEKSKQSVVPPMFWWMSLIGSLMLLTYFLWRRDVVGILGQGIGLTIYVRNLHLIYLARRQTLAAEATQMAAEHIEAKPAPRETAAVAVK
jgi:lipid-A-disaccharide synthase-like uncharacterized protein